MQTKITVSKYWKNSSIILACMSVIFSVAILYVAFLIDEFEFYIFLGVCCFGLLFCVSYLIFAMRSLMTDVIITDDEFQSVFSNIKLAKVNKQESVYYVVFEELVRESQMDNMTYKKFILVSNTPFKYLPRKNIFYKSMLGRYDIHTQILLPYNSETFKFFDLEKWIFVG